MASLLEDLQGLAAHLSPSDFGTSDPLVGALIKVLEHEGLKAPTASELLPEDHPSQISPPAPTQPGPSDGDRLSRIESTLEGLGGALERLLGAHPHTSDQAGASTAAAGSETSAPSSEPASSPASPDAPELDRP